MPSILSILNSEPAGIKPAERLCHYASVFNAVEINYTFRRFPTESLLAGWRDQTPPGFRFVLKANSRITHTKRLKNTREDMSAWIRDPQTFKPGTAMPATPLSQEDLDAVVAYLGGLQ